MEPMVASFPSPADSLEIATYSWATTSEPPRGVIQLAHGIAEYALRYDRLAQALVDDGWLVYANDHRGHGDSTNDATPLGSFGAAGWPALVQDLVAFTDRIAAAHPGLPLFLVGHSMGSFAAQEAIAFNAAFENRTGYEWLSRDEAEVDAYVADPRSGFDLPDDTIPQLFVTAPRLGDPDALEEIVATLPILIVSGRDDPLSGNGQLVELLAQRYREAGVADVTLKIYDGARHEVFNETNRDEITAFVIDWLDAHA
jgi:alpha-beta hydrolase superfamily lysophospholipase